MAIVTPRCPKCRNPLHHSTAGKPADFCSYCEAEPSAHAPLLEQLRAWADDLDAARVAGWDVATLRAEVAGIVKGMRQTADDLERDGGADAS